MKQVQDLVCGSGTLFLEGSRQKQLTGKIKVRKKEEVTGSSLMEEA